MIIGRNSISCMMVTDTWLPTYNSRKLDPPRGSVPQGIFAAT